VKKNKSPMMSSSFSSKLTDIDDRRWPPINTSDSNRRRTWRQSGPSAVYTSTGYVSSNGDASSTSDLEDELDDDFQTQFNSRRRNAVVAANYTGITTASADTDAEESGVPTERKRPGIWRVLTSIMERLESIQPL